MPGAVRLIFSYEGNDIKLESRQRVNMVVAPGEPVVAEGAPEERSGFWVEIRDGADQPLRRQLLHNPIPRDAEVFSDDPAQSVARIPLERPSGVFSVLVPEIEEAEYVALIGTPPEQPADLVQAREIARFSL